MAAYQVRYTENNNSNKKAIIVDDKSINSQTSLNLVGSNFPNYASYIGGDLLHLLENYANPTPPVNPVQGQLWYDNVNNQLMVNTDATESSWISSGSVIKSALQPETARSGDLWVNNVKQQLYLYTGVSWILVGPEYSQDTLTGQIIETIYDNTDNLRGIISVYSENNRVAIISSETFTPKLAIPGFAVVNAGMTLVNSDDQSLPGQTLSTHRYYGTSTNSDRLGGELASKYVLSTANLVSFTGSLKSSNISVGTDRNLYIGDDPSSTTNYLISTTASTTKTLELYMSGKTIASFLPSGRIGILTKTPSCELDVNGTTTSNKLIVDGTNDVVYTGSQTASTQLNGGLYVSKSVLVGSSGNLTITNGTITVSNTDTNIVLTPSVNKIYDIGSDNKNFRNVYSQTFYGNLEGNVVGNVSGDVSGNVSGNAGSLKTTARFELSGDIYSSSLSYNGTQTSINFATLISSSAYSSKPELYVNANSTVNPSASSDQLLIYRSQGEETAKFSAYISGTTLHVVPTSIVSTTGSVGSISGTGPWTAIISGMSSTAHLSVGSVLTATSGTGSLYGGTPTSVVVTNIINSTSVSYTVTGGTIPTAGTITNVTTSLSSGLITVGSSISGTGVLTGTKIVSGSGTIWTVNTSQTVGTLQSPVIITATSKLFKTTKQTFLSNVPVVKPGTIILYPNDVPEGYLKCDGEMYYQSDYPDLFYALGSESIVDAYRFNVPSIQAPSSGNLIVLNYIIFTGIL